MGTAKCTYTATLTTIKARKKDLLQGRNHRIFKKPEITLAYSVTMSLGIHHNELTDIAS